MATWRHFARRTFPVVVRELGIPCATGADTRDRARCPRHGTATGITRMCLDCFNEAWREVARRYADADQGAVLKGEPAMSTTQIVDGETGELVPYEPPAPMTLFGTNDPRVALERMAEIATALVDVIDKKHLFATINGRRHITAEGWTTLGGMLGVVPVVTETRANDTGDGIVARVEARTLDGRVVGAAEGECSRAERRWKDRDPYALRSMAQTRAISRALRAPLGQIVVLAGYDPAAAEEIPADDQPVEREPAIPREAQPTAEQLAAIRALIGRLAEQQPDVDWRARCHKITGVPGNMLTRGGADGLIRKLGELDREPGEVPFE